MDDSMLSGYFRRPEELDLSDPEFTAFRWLGEFLQQHFDNSELRQLTFYHLGPSGSEFEPGGSASRAERACWLTKQLVLFPNPDKEKAFFAAIVQRRRLLSAEINDLELSCRRAREALRNRHDRNVQTAGTTGRSPTSANRRSRHSTTSMMFRFVASLTVMLMFAAVAMVIVLTVLPPSN